MTRAAAPRPRLQGYLHVVVPALAAIASHVTALSAGFVWLDHAHIEQGYAIARPSDWPGLFTEGFARTGFYRPLMSLSLSIDALAGTPFVFHASNLLWHVANAIAFRSEAMIAVALFGLVAAHLHRRPALAALALLAGALTKETALVLGPLFVVALELSAVSPRRGPASPLPIRLGSEMPGAPAVAFCRTRQACCFRLPHVRAPVKWQGQRENRACSLRARPSAVAVLPPYCVGLGLHLIQ